MKFITTRLPGKLVLALGILAIALPPAFGQLNSNTASVTLNATLSESLTVAATPSAVNFTLASGGTATGDNPVAITTSWVLNSSRSTVTLTGYFTNANAALTNGAATNPANIPTSEVLGKVSTGSPTSYTAFTQAPSTGGLGNAGASLELFTQAITSTNVASSRSDNLDLEIDLTHQTQLPAGTYSGTLNLQAQAL